MRSSPADVPVPPLREGICWAESRETVGGLPHVRASRALGVLFRPPTPLGAFAALRTGLWGGAYAFATPGGLPCSDCPGFRHAALLDPAEVSAPSPIAGARCCLPVVLRRRPSDNFLTRLNHFTLAGCGLVVALPTLHGLPYGWSRKARFAVGGWPFGGRNCTYSVQSASRRTKPGVVTGGLWGCR